MDPIDRKILGLLQADASVSVGEIASKVGLSQTPCWNRIQKMEAAGVIKGRVALLNNKKLNLGLTGRVRHARGGRGLSYGWRY